MHLHFSANPFLFNSEEKRLEAEGSISTPMEWEEERRREGEDGGT